MFLDSNTMISVTEANQNFSRVARLVDQYGTAVIMKNNAPRYLIIDFAKANFDRIATNAEVVAASAALIQRNASAYEALAK